MKVIIAGGGKNVYFLSRTFISKGYTVTLINPDREECVSLARRLKATVVQGDGSLPAVLEEAGAHAADAILAMTPKDQDNLVICQLASLRFNVPRCVAVVVDPDNAELFKRLGVTAFSTTPTVASLIEQRVALEDITNLLPVEEGKVNITEISLLEESPAVGRSLRDLHLPPDCLVGVVLRKGQPLVPRGETLLFAGDRVVLITLPQSHGPALKALTGGY